MAWEKERVRLTPPEVHVVDVKRDWVFERRFDISRTLLALYVGQGHTLGLARGYGNSANPAIPINHPLHFPTRQVANILARLRDLITGLVLRLLFVNFCSRTRDRTQYDEDVPLKELAVNSGRAT